MEPAIGASRSSSSAQLYDVDLPESFNDPAKTQVDVVRYRMRNSYAVYEWRAWDRFILARLIPEAFRIQAKIDDLPENLVQCLPKDVTHFIFHLNLTLTGKFPLERETLIRLLAEKGIGTINAQLTDARKKHIQSLCQKLGLNSVLVTQRDDPNTPVIVKSNFNYGAEKEQLLTDDERRLLGIPPLPFALVGSRAYQQMPLGKVRESWWSDPTISVERYVTNKENKFYRAYFSKSSIVISRVVNPAFIKKLRHPRSGPRENFFFHLHGKELFAVAAHPLVSNLLDAVAAMVRGFRLDFGAMDIVVNDGESPFIIDVNGTPYWGEKAFQPNVLEFLRQGLDSPDSS